MMSQELINAAAGNYLCVLSLQPTLFGAFQISPDVKPNSTVYSNTISRIDAFQSVASRTTCIPSCSQTLVSGRIAEAC